MIAMHMLHPGSLDADKSDIINPAKVEGGTQPARLHLSMLHIMHNDICDVQRGGIVIEIGDWQVMGARIVAGGRLHVPPDL